MYITNLDIDIPFAQSTIKNIMYTYNKTPISRKVEQYKPILDADTME
jgi:hypothetical protein